ncbi:MAG: protein kinase [Proteobacteria bacterium]|nr:protein kinase [Pseudomonadota bacterium]
MKPQDVLNMPSKNESNWMEQSSLLTALPEAPGADVKITVPKPSLGSPTKLITPQLDSGGSIRIDITIPASAFTLERLLGKGGFGTVYAGLYNGKPVAIKQLSAHLTTEALEELKHEAEIMVQLVLRSEHIVAIKGICLEAPYSLVMELMPNGSLYDLLHNGKDLPWMIRYQIALDAAWGLKDLHDFKILHRDLKSLNILLNDRFRAKLADFGLAKVKNETSSQSSVAKGTVLWMAPELFDDEPKMTTASDVYSFGMVLWELATRLLPYAKAPNQMVAARWIEKGKKEEFPGDCPPKLKSIIESCWETLPIKRPTATQLMEQLKPLLEIDREKKLHQSTPVSVPELKKPIVVKAELPSLPPLISVPKWEYKPVSSNDIKEFLQLVVQGEQDKAEAMIQKDKNLLLTKVSVQDLSKSEFKQITAFQYALWALDWHMWKMFQKYLPLEVQAEQCFLWESKEDKDLPHGKHFSLQPLIDASQIYENELSKRSDKNSDYRKLGDCYRSVGNVQSLLPVHVVNEYCHPKRPFFPCPNFQEETLPRTQVCERENATYDWFRYQNETKSRSDYKSAKMGLGWPSLKHDITALQALSKIRTQQWESLKLQLKEFLPTPPPLPLPLAQLLQFVAEGEQDKAEAMIQKDKNLLLTKGNVKDLSQREFKQITAFQYALWAMDWHMWKMIRKYLPTEAQAQQFSELESKSTPHDKHFSLYPLVKALWTYIESALGYSIFSKNQKIADYWVKGVGKAQKQLPAHVANEYCYEGREFDPCPTFTEEKLPRVRTSKYFIDTPKYFLNNDESEWHTYMLNEGGVGDTFAYGPTGGCTFNTSKGEVIRNAPPGVGAWLGSSPPSERLIPTVKGLRILAETRVQQLKFLASELKLTSPEFCQEEATQMQLAQQKEAEWLKQQMELILERKKEQEEREAKRKLTSNPPKPAPKPSILQKLSQTFMAPPKSKNIAQSSGSKNRLGR